MVALPPVEDVIRVTLRGTYGPATWVNGIYMGYTSSGTPSSEDLLALCDDIATAWEPVRLVLSNECRLTEVGIVDLGSDTGASVLGAVLKVGDVASAGPPANVAACVSFKIGRRYRGGHPRNYVCGFPTTAVADKQKFTSTFANALASAYNTFRNTCAGATTTQPTIDVTQWVNVSYYLGHTFDAEHNRIPTPRPIPKVDTVTSCAVNTRIDSQRRRLS